MKFFIAFLKILSLCVLAANTDDGDSGLPSPTPIQTVTLDISSDSRFQHAIWVPRVLDNYVFHVFEPREDIEITKVVDGDQLIWEDEYVGFEFGKLVFREKKPFLLILDFYPFGKSYYENIDGVWVEKHEEQFNSILRDLRLSVPTKSIIGLNLRFTKGNPAYSVEKHDATGGILHVYVPTQGYLIKAVYDDRNTVWMATEPSQRCVAVLSFFKGERPSLVRVLLVSDYIQVTEFNFIRKHGDWVQIYGYNFEDATILFCQKHIDYTEFNLDLKNIDYDAVDIRSRTYEYPFVKYIPKEDHKIISVSHGSDEIWKSDKPDKFFPSSVDFFDNGGPEIVRINFYFNKPVIHEVYVKTDDGWRKGNYSESEERTKSLQKQRFKVFDLGSVDKEVVSYFQLSMEGVDYLLLSPRIDSDIMVIKHGDQVLWNYTGIQSYFSNGWLYYYPTLPKLFHFRVRDMCFRHDDQYFINVDGDWKQISKEDYVDSLNLIVYSTKKGFNLEDIPGYKEYIEKINKSKPEEDSAEGESSKKSPLGPGFKEKLYAKYALPDFDPTDDEDALGLFSYVNEEGLDDESTELSASFEYLKLPDFVYKHTQKSDEPEVLVKRKLSFTHYEPREFREPKEILKRPATPMPPYSSMRDLSSSEEESDKHLRHRKYKSTSDIDRRPDGELVFTTPNKEEMPTRASTPTSPSGPSTPSTPSTTPSPSTPSTPRLLIRPRTPIGTPTPRLPEEAGLPRTPTPSRPATPSRIKSQTPASPSVHPKSATPVDQSQGVSPTQVRRRPRPTDTKEDPSPPAPNEGGEKPSDPDFAFTPALSSLFFILILSVMF